MDILLGKSVLVFGFGTLPMLFEQGRDDLVSWTAGARENSFMMAFVFSETDPDITVSKVRVLASSGLFFSSGIPYSEDGRGYFLKKIVEDSQRFNDIKKFFLFTRQPSEFEIGKGLGFNSIMVTDEKLFFRRH